MRSLLLGTPTLGFEVLSGFPVGEAGAAQLSSARRGVPCLAVWEPLRSGLRAGALVSPGRVEGAGFLGSFRVERGMACFSLAVKVGSATHELPLSTVVAEGLG